MIDQRSQCPLGREINEGFLRKFRNVNAASDPLSTAMTKMKLRAFVDVALDAGGNWAVGFPAYDGFTLNVVQKGECWLSIAGTKSKVRLRAGDCFLLTGGKDFTLATNPSLKKRFRAEALFSQAQDGVATCNGGGDFFVIGIIFRFQGHLPLLLFDRLPPAIHVDGGSDQAAVLRGSLDRFSAERRTGGIGRLLILSHLAPIMLVQMLRLYLAASPKEQNWLIALSQPRLSPSLMRCRPITNETGPSENSQSLPTCHGPGSRSCSGRR